MTDTYGLKNLIGNSSDNFKSDFINKINNALKKLDGVGYSSPASATGEPVGMSVASPKKSGTTPDVSDVAYAMEAPKAKKKKEEKIEKILRDDSIYANIANRSKIEPIEKKSPLTDAIKALGAAKAAGKIAEGIDVNKLKNYAKELTKPVTPAKNIAEASKIIKEAADKKSKALTEPVKIGLPAEIFGDERDEIQTQLADIVSDLKLDEKFKQDAWLSVLNSLLMNKAEHAVEIVSTLQEIETLAEQMRAADEKEKDNNNDLYL